MLKELWRRIVERRKRIKAELDQVELEMALEEELKRRRLLLRPPLLFPQRPYKASTIVLFTVFGFFAAVAAWVCFKGLVIPFFR